MAPGPIGVFDSGYGGLTILKALETQLPEYDYLYLGDNARAPYGTRSFDVVYDFTKQAVVELFNRGCNLVILACNTASAKALRNIQIYDLPNFDPLKRVLGVIRPSTEVLGEMSTTKHVGVLATPGTVLSQSYSIELKKFSPELIVVEHACPMWVPLIENDRHLSEAGKIFVKEDFDILLNSDNQIDTVMLGCTHYPLLAEYLKSIAPKNVKIVGQGEIVANSLKDYFSRHTSLEKKCLKNGRVQFLTTESAAIFNETAAQFYHKNIQAERIKLV